MKTLSGIQATSKTVCFRIVDTLRGLVDAGLLERGDLQPAAVHLIGALEGAFIHAMDSLPQLKGSNQEALVALASEPETGPDGELAVLPTPDGASFDVRGLERWWREHTPSADPSYDSVRNEAARLVSQVLDDERPIRAATEGTPLGKLSPVELAVHFVTAYLLHHRGRVDSAEGAENLALTIAALAPLRGRPAEASAAVTAAPKNTAAPEPRRANGVVAYLDAPRKVREVPQAATKSGRRTIHRQSGGQRDVAGLRTVVDKVAMAHLRTGPAEKTSLESCLALLESLERELYHEPPQTAFAGHRGGPSAVRAGMTVNDSHIGTGREDMTLARGRTWTRVGTSWASLVKAVEAQGVGTTALVLGHRPNGRIGHAVALSHTTEGLRWIEPQGSPGNRVLVTKPGRLAAVFARAVLIDARGNVVHDALPHWQESDSLGASLTDAATNRRYGARDSLDSAPVKLRRPDTETVPVPVTDDKHTHPDRPRARTQSHGSQPAAPDVAEPIVPLDRQRTITQSASRQAEPPTDLHSTVQEEGPAPTDPATTFDRQAPSRITEGRRLAASDLLVSLHQQEAVIVDRITAVFERAFGADMPAARTIVEQAFGPETLRPLISAMTRNERWATPISGGGWSGQIAVRAVLGDLRYRHTESPVEIEFEGGSSHQGSREQITDRRRRLQGNLQGRLTFATWSMTESLSVSGEHLRGDKGLHGGSFIARHKTKEAAALFDGDVKLLIDLSGLMRHGRPFTSDGNAGPLSIPGIAVTVAIPERDTVDATGRSQHFEERLAPPSRLTAGRMALSDIVTDVWPADAASSDAVSDLLRNVDSEGQRFFGRSLWPSIRGKLTEELSLSALHQNLTGMTAGQPLTVEAFNDQGAVTGTIEITAKVVSAVQSGETRQTEFNVGTAVVRSLAHEDVSSHALQLPAPLQFNVTSMGGQPITTGGGSSVQFGRDRVRQSRTVFEIGTTTKTKVPGVLFDGVAELQFAMHKGTPRPDRDSTEARTRLCFTVLLERHEAGRAEALAEPDGPTALADPTPPVDPRTGHRLWEPGTVVHAPPAEIWSAATGGLNDRVVVRDLPDLSTLRERIDRLGRQAVGRELWDTTRADVLAAFHQQRLAARITSMTRGYELRSPVVDGVALSATAAVERMEFKYYQDKAELNTVNESTTSESAQRLWSDTTAAQVSGGGTATVDHTGDTLNVGGVHGEQWRYRQGTQHGITHKLASNGKSRDPRAIFTAWVKVAVTVTDVGRQTVELPVEISMDARETQLYTVGEDGLAVFTRDTITRRQTPILPPTPRKPPQRFTERGAMSASDVVHSLGPETIQVLNDIETELRTRFGTLSDEVRERLSNRFDPFVLAAELSSLTRGGAIRAEVPLRGHRVTIVVRAELAPGFRHLRSIPHYEFEFGTQQRVSSGTTQDFWHRRTTGPLLRFKDHHAEVWGGYQQLWDRSRGLAQGSTARGVSSVKTVEDADLFEGHVLITTEIVVHGLAPRTIPPGPPVKVVTTISVPSRDTDPGSVQPLGKPDWPRRIADSLRLGSTDIVTDVYLLGPERGRDAGAEHTIRPLDESGSTVLGTDWRGMREKIRAALLDRDLPAKLKPMMAGHEIVLRHGRSTVRISAHVEELSRANRTGSTEFNSGVGMQRGFASTDGSIMEGRGIGHSVTAGALVTVPTPIGVSPVVGGNVTVSWGQDRQDREAWSIGVGVSSKAKHPAVSYVGVARLVIRMERAPLVAMGDQNRVVPQPPRSDGFPRAAWRSLRRIGTPSRTMASMQVGFTALVESETAEGASKAAAPMPARPDGLLPKPVEVRIPPRRVWSQGLLDTDVVRDLNSEGIADILRVFGARWAGKRSWEQMAETAQHTLDRTRLATHVNLRSAEEDLSVPYVRRRLIGPASGVHANLRVVSLRYVGLDAKAELSPANEVSTTRTNTRLHWNSLAAQAQVGVAEGTAFVGGRVLAGFGSELRKRQGSSLVDGGHTVSHGKLPTPMAVYHGYVEVSVTIEGPSGPRRENGVVPVEIAIPVNDTEVAEVNRIPIFTPRQQGVEGYVVTDPRQDGPHMERKGLDDKVPDIVPEADGQIETLIARYANPAEWAENAWGKTSQNERTYEVLSAVRAIVTEYFPALPLYIHEAQEGFERLPRGELLARALTSDVMRGELRLPADHPNARAEETAAAPRTRVPDVRSILSYCAAFTDTLEVLRSPVPLVDAPSAQRAKTPVHDDHAALGDPAGPAMDDEHHPVNGPERGNSPGAPVPEGRRNAPDASSLEATPVPPVFDEPHGRVADDAPDARPAPPAHDEALLHRSPAFDENGGAKGAEAALPAARTSLHGADPDSEKPETRPASPAGATRTQEQQADEPVSRPAPTSVFAPAPTDYAPGLALGPEWRPLAIEVEAIRHEIEFPLPSLLGGEDVSRTLARLAELMEKLRSTIGKEREEVARQVDEAINPLVERAAEHIRRHLAGSTTHVLGMENSDFVLTTVDNSQVALVFAQTLADKLEHRVMVQLSAGMRATICND
ncbi:toxin glutamine deamidase domain-containing protein [Streptomyces sp. NPDC002265]|uniref:toxin glutamine deamidase domain-containing protein n=1 Tax=Streptomyces sp. NPDC002265 TaxID=3154415 RepID=UPI00332A7005